jgi:hypothetical protein
MNINSKGLIIIKVSGNILENVELTKEVIE